MSQPDDDTRDASGQHSHHHTDIQGTSLETDPLIPTTNTKSAAPGTQQGNIVLVFLGLQIALFAAALE